MLVCCVMVSVTGCSRTSIPSFAGASVEMSADSETALVQCDVTSHVRWLVRCVDSKWRVDGDVGNCSTPDAESSGKRFGSTYSQGGDSTVYDRHR